MGLQPITKECGIGHVRCYIYIYGFYRFTGPRENILSCRQMQLLKKVFVIIIIEFTINQNNVSQ